MSDLHRSALDLIANKYGLPASCLSLDGDVFEIKAKQYVMKMTGMAALDIDAAYQRMDMATRTFSAQIVKDWMTKDE